MSFLKNKHILSILIAGVIIRLAIIPFYFHPDIKTYYFQSSFLKKGVLNIYDYLDKHNLELPYKENFVYFPLTYYFLGSYQFVVSPFLGENFDKWLNDASLGSILQIGVYRYLLILKLPYLIADISIAFLLTKLFNQIEDKQKIFKLWMLNPFSIAIIYIFSNIDVLIVLMTVLSLLFAKKSKFLLAALMLGLGAGFKAYPIFFIPLIFFYTQKWKDRVLLLVISLGTFLAIIAPFLKSKVFLQSTLASGLTTRLFIPNLNIGFNESINIPLLILAIYLIYFVKKSKKEFLTLNNGFLAILLVIFSFIHFHIQWLIWLMPFICVLLVKRKSDIGLFILLGLVGVAIPFLYDDKYMNVALLNAVSTSYSLLPSFYRIVNKFVDPSIVMSLLHTLFAGISLFLIWITSKENYED